MNLISIVTPSYNQGAYLEQTIQSVLGQDHPNIQYMVVDGGSTDGSVEIIRKYSDKLAWWVSERDSGQAEAINKGLKRANGEVVAWLNSDDYYLPGTVSAAMKIFAQNDDVVMIYGDLLAVDEQGQSINVMKFRPLSLRDLLCFQIIGQPSVFFRRSALATTGLLDPSYHYLLDHQLWIRLAQHGRILHVDQTWAAARYHAGAKNRAYAAEFGREAFRMLEWAKSQPALAESISGVNRRALASAHRVDARYLLDGGRPASALAAWTRALFIHPPTALARLNILVSALSEMIGLGGLRILFLRRRSQRVQDRGNSGRGPGF